MRKNVIKILTFVLMFFICACGKSEVSEQKEIAVYNTNEDATAFEVKKAEIDQITPEKVLHEIIMNNVLTEEIEILDFQTLEVDGEDAIEIDFNDVFSQYLSGKGSTGEYYCLGSVCNTFLDAYDCELIKITVAGEELATGHNVYPNYMGKFE